MYKAILCIILWKKICDIITKFIDEIFEHGAEFTVAAIDVFALDKNVRIASIDVNFHLYCCYKFHRYSSIIDCWGSYKSHVVGYFTPAGFSLTIRVRRNMYRFYYWIWYKNGPQWIEFRSIHSEQFYYNLS